MQSALQAMDTYFSAQDHPSRLRVNDAGNIEVASKFTQFFDGITDAIRSRFDEHYKPVNRASQAREMVIHKLEQSLQTLLPGQPEVVHAKVQQLMSNVCNRLKNDKSGITWRRALDTEFEIMNASDTGAAVSTAARVLLDIGRFMSPHIEFEVLGKIGKANIDFARLTVEGQQTLESAVQESLRNHLASTHDLPLLHADFGAQVLMYAMNFYQLTMHDAMKLMDIPSALRSENGYTRRPDFNRFVHEQIARTIHRKTGAPTDLARKNSAKIEYCMRRYGMDWKQALDLVGFAGRIAQGNKQAATEKDNDRPPEVNMDYARAVQQIIARDRCDVHHALRIVERRMEALPRIQRCLPVGAMPSFVNGMQCRVSTPISESSRAQLRQKVSTLNLEARSAWTEPASKTVIKVAESFLLDAPRNLRIALEDEGQMLYFDKRNSDQLIPGVYAFAGDPEVMKALADSFNQAILGSILEIIKGEQGEIYMRPPENVAGTNHQLLWHTGKRNGTGKIVIRHLHMQKVDAIGPNPYDTPWRVNQGPHWQGDANPANAGFMLDFSYAFDENDLKNGLRNPEILECRYSTSISLDWDSIDRELEETAAAGAESP